ncbi:B3 domain-containing protein REM19 [Glycine max]|uniref:B3 domain-containing protein REM19 n=1 Tax=Glycine max TaxID=3847 RepID=UPI001B357577|nr:B3 domain-containing protein REM19-like [Glycine max]
MHVVNDSVQVLDNATPTTSYPPPRKKLRTRSSGVVGQSSYLPQENKGGATDRGETSGSKAPSFGVRLKPSYVNGFSLYLKEKRRDDILLQVSDGSDGRTWLIEFRRDRFYRGWRNFASDNHLETGDICVFELTKNQEYINGYSFLPLNRFKGDADPWGIPDLKSITTLPIEGLRTTYVCITSAKYYAYFGGIPLLNVPTSE